MTPNEIVTCLNTASLTHLLAVDAAVATMRNLPTDDPARIALKIGLQNSQGRIGAAYSNVVPLFPDKYEAALARVATEMEAQS
jgi:hypothetical protein